MRKLLSALNLVARWRESRQRNQRLLDHQHRASLEEARIFRAFIEHCTETTPFDISELLAAIHAGKAGVTAKLRTRDILVRYSVPLPKHLRVRRQHTDEAKENMSAAQQQRRAKERERAVLETE